MQQEKTVMEWLQYADEMGYPWAEKAIELTVGENGNHKMKSLSQALFYAFGWTKQKGSYWHSIYHTLRIAEEMYSQNQSSAQTPNTQPDRVKIAAMALQGLLSNPDYSAGPALMSEKAVTFTDALISELSKEQHHETN